MAAARRPVHPPAARLGALRPVCLAAASALLLAVAPAAWALPDGATPTQGQAQLAHTAPGTLQIRQTTQLAGFDWRSFSIAAGERVQVLQPNAQAILFNRVTGADPSLILGQLQANGRVFLSNPRGIVFGASAQVDVGGLLATTLSVNTTAGADGRWQLSAADGATGLLRMDGSIRAPGGTVALVGPQLSVGGNVLAGRLGLAAAGAVQVDVDGDGLIFFNLRDEHLDARLHLLPAASLLARSAELRAAARSQFADTVLNLEGVVRAQGLVQQGGQVVIGGPAPRILVDGGTGGITRVAGTLDASATGAGDTGGQVRVRGERVWLDSTARLDARGDAGGGLVEVGGAWQGLGPGRNALHTRVAAGAQLDASAIRLGPGGQVVVWADDSTVFNGHIRARGGLLGGDGGAVETSGKLRLGIGSGTVDAGAAPGFRAGRWLLDPLDITVSTAGTTTTSDGIETWDDAPGTTLTITPTALQKDDTNVLLQATRDVTIDAAVSLNTGQAFSAEAGRHVVVAASGSVTTQNRPISLVAGKDMDGPSVGTPPTSGGAHSADATGRVSVQGSLDAGTGSITIGLPGSTGQHLLGNSPTAASITAGTFTVLGATALGGALSLDVSSLVLAGAVTLAADTGISVAGTRSLTIAGAIGDGSAPAAARSLTKLGTGSLSLTGTNAYRGGTVVAGGTLRVSANGQLGDVAGAVTLQNDATLAWDAGSTAQTTGRAVELGSGGGTLAVTGTLGVTGALSGAGTLTKAGSGNLSLAHVAVEGNSGFTGKVQLAEGTLALDWAKSLSSANAVALSTTAASTLAVNTDTTLGALSGGAAGETPFGSVVIAAGKTLSADGSGAALAAKVSGGGALTKVGAGTLVLARANEHTGGTVVSGGTLQVSADGQLGNTAGTVTLQNGATLAWDAGSTAQTTGRAVVLGTDGGTLDITGTLTLTGALSGSSALTKAGDGTLSLANAAVDGNSGFSGSVTLAAGTLSLDAANALRSANAVTLGTTADATLAVNTSTTLGALSGGVAGDTPFGKVVIGAGITLSADGGATALAARVSGAGELSKVGAGTLVLAGANTHTGGTVVAGGTLQIGADGQLGDAAGDLTLQGGATLAWDAGSTAQSTGRTLVLGTDGGTLGITGTVAFNGALSGSGRLTKAGGGTLSLAGDGSGFLGAVRLNAGTLALDSAAPLASTTDVSLSTTAASTLVVNTSTALGALSGGAAGATPLGSVVIADGQVLSADGDGAALAARVSGDGALAKVGAGTLVLTGANTHTGGTRVAGGTLRISDNQHLGAAAAGLTLQGGGTLAWDAGGGAQSISRAVTVAGTGGTLDVAGGVALALTGAMAGSGPLAKAGDGALSLAGSNASFTGAVRLDGGLLSLDSGTALGAGNAVTLSNTAPSTLAVNADVRIGALSGGSAGSVLLGLDRTLSADGNGSALAAAVSGDGALAKVGTGTLLLTGANLHGGGTSVQGGTLQLGGAAALPTGTDLRVSGGVLDLNGQSADIATLHLSGGEVRNGTLSATQFALQAGSIGADLQGGVGGLVKTGGGQVTLSGTNTYIGDTTVSAGTLVLSGNGALPGGGALTIDGTGSVDLGNTSRSVGAFVLDGSGSVGNGTLSAGLFQLRAGQVDASLSGTGSLVKQGTGSVALNQASPGFAGVVNLLGGTLALNAAGALNAGNLVSLDGPAGTTLAVNASNSVQALAGNSNGTVVIAAGRTLTHGSAGGTASSSFGGRITGAGGLGKQGSGSLTLDGSNDFSGGTTVAGGTLVLNGGAALHDTGPVQVATGATLQIGAAETVGALSGGGNVVLPGPTLTVRSDTASSFSGRIEGTGGLVKQGGGVLTLSGSNSHTGGTTVQAGTLELAGTQALADGGALQVDSGATLRLAGSETVGALSGAGSIVLGVHTLTFGGLADTLFSGAIGGDGGVVKQGFGSVTLSGANAFVGGTVVQAGTLSLAGGAALHNAGPLQVDAGATVRLLDSETVGPLSGAGSVVLGLHTLTTGGGANSEFSGALSGDGGLVKQGAGRFTLSGSNQPAAGTRVAAGTLVLANAGALPDAAAVQVDTGATLQLAASKTLAALTGTGAVALDSHTLTLDNAADTSFAGAIDGLGGLVKRGGGALRLSGSNRFTGGTMVEGGSLRLAGSAALADAGALQLGAGTSLHLEGSETVGTLSGAGAVALGAHTLTVDAAADATFSGAIGGGGALVKRGAGVLTLAGANSQLGGTTLAGGVVLADADARLGAAGATLTLDGGTLRATGGQTLTLAADRPVVVAAAGGVLSATATSTLAVAGAVSGSGTLAKAGAGELQLQGDNRGFTGALDVRAGTLRASGGRALPDAGTLTLAGTATLAVDSTETLGQLSGSGAVQLAGSSQLRIGTAADATFNGSFSGAGSLRKQGAGTLTLTAASSHAGGTLVTGGALAVAADAALGGSSAALTLDGGSLRLTGAAPLQLAATRGLVLGAAGGTLDVQAAGGQLDVAGPLSGSGTLRKQGAGSLRLAGTSSGFSGTVELTGGTLRLANGSALPDATALSLAAGSLLQIDTSETLGALSGTGAVALQPGTLLTLGTAADASFGGSFGGAGGLVKQGSGTLTLGAASSHTGGTQVRQGRLLISADSQLGAAASALLLDGGTLATTGTGNLVLDAGRSLQVGLQGGTLDVAADAGLDVRGPLSGGGALVKQGAGGLQLAGDNSGFSGALDLLAGSLALQHALALGGANALHLGAGTLLDVQQSLTIGSLSGAGDATLAAGTTLSTGLASSRFDGRLLGDGALLKLGGGVFTLAGANAQRGGTRVQDGMLQLLGGQALPDDAPLVMAGGTLLVDASEQAGALSGSGSVALAVGQVLRVGAAGSTRFDGSFTGSGALHKQGSGTLTLGGSSGHSGGTTVAGGVLAVAADAALGNAAAALTLDGGSLRATGAGTVALAPQRAVVVGVAGGTLAVDAGTTLQVQGPLSGNGGLAKSGDGLLALAGASPAFSGAVQLAGGSLALQQAQALGPANAVDLATGTSLALGADVRLGPLSGAGAAQLQGFTLASGGAGGTFSGTLGGGGVFQWLGDGQLTLDAATGFNGSTQVLGGTLALAQADALTGSPVSVGPGATLAVLASSRVQSLSQPGADAGQVVLSAGATLSTGAAADTRFTGPIRGEGALRKLGSGRFTLAGANSYSGGTVVEAGILQGDSLALQGDITVATQLVFDQGSDGRYGGRVTGAGSLAKQGAGSLLLDGVHQHGGGTQVLAGTLHLAGGQAVPDAGAVDIAAGAALQVDASETLARLTGAGALQLQPGATLTLGDAASTRFDGTLAGAGSLVKQGSGQLTLAGASGHSGGTLVQAGSLALAAPGVLADSTVTLASQPGVALRLLGDARIGALASSDGPAAPVVALGSFTLAAGGNGSSTRFAGSTQGSGSLVKQGAGTLTLAGSNGHTGATQVQAGSLVLAGAQALDAASAVQVDAGASLVLAAAQTIGTLAGDGSVQLDGFQLTTEAAADSLFGGRISGSGGLAKRGAGHLTLAGTNVFTGLADVQQGTLALAGGAALADGVRLQIGAAGTVVAGGSETVGALAGSGALVLEPGRFTTGGSGSDTRFDGPLSGSGQLAKAGAGRLTLGGANSHTGGLVLLGGTLAVAADSALGAVPDAGTPSALLFDGGTLQATASFTLAPTRLLVLQGTGGTLQVDAGHTLAVPATLADGSSAGALAKTGAGTLSLTAAADSARSGSTAVLAGALALQRDGQLGSPAGALVLDGGTLQVDQSLSLADARVLQLGASGGTLQVAAGATLQLGGLVGDQPGAGGGALAKTGDGRLLLSGAADNTYTGATLLRGGSLALQRDGQLGAAPVAATAGHLLIDGATVLIDGDTVLAATRGLALGSGGATLQVSDGRVAALAGSLADAPGAAGGTLAKTGGGMLRLQGAVPSSHTGATQVLAGTLALSADSQLGAVPGTATPGHLLLDGGTLLADAGFTLAASRGLQLGAGGGTLAVAAGQQLAYGGVLSGASADPALGALSKAGDGRLVLSGANTHAGATLVRGGVLAIDGDAQLGSAPASATPAHLLIDGGTLAIGASTTLVASRGIGLGAGGAVLDIADGASVAYDGTLADLPGVAGGIDKTGAGRLLLGRAATHSGTTRVLAGTLATEGAQRLPQGGAVQLANQASLVLGGNQTLAALGDAPNPGGAAADGSALVDLGAFTLRLDTGAGDERSFYSGAVTGQGGQLLKQGGGTLQLAGSGAGRNQVTVDAGLLVSLGSNSLSGGAEVTVAPGAALRLMAPVSVQSLDLAGRLSGPGGLTASASVDLRDAVVDTSVATPVLRSHGSSQINAAVQADSSTVAGGMLALGSGGNLTTATLALQGGATLATQAAGQLGGRPAVVVDTGTLQLAGAEQVATLHLAGTLAGSGHLVVDQGATLQGAQVLAGLQAETLRSSGNTLLQAPVLARSGATLAGGTLTLADSGRLDTPLLTLEAGTLATGASPALSTDSRLVVQRGATLLLGADQRLASLDLAGTLGAAPGPLAALPDGQQRALADSPAAAQLQVDGGVLLDGATVFTPLTAATLTSTGSTTLAAPVLSAGPTTVAGGLLSVAANGLLTTPSLQVQAGGVATGGAQRLQAGTQLALAAGTSLQLGGDQVLARLTDLGAAAGPAAPAQVQLGNFTLAAGADGSDAVFSGRFSGDGTVAKQGAGTWLLRSDQAHGDTRIEAGTLQLGDGGNSGSLGRGAVANDGLLRFQRGDAVRLTQAVSGSGSLQQAGSGSLSLASTALSYTGDTVVSSGSLRTEGADRLPDATHLRLAAGATLATGGDDRLGALTADGAVSLGGGLATSGSQLFGGPVTVTSSAPITLAAPAARVEALHVGNQWGTQPLSVDAGVLLLGAGRAGAAGDAAWNPLTLGQVTLRGLADGGTSASGSQIDAGKLQIGAPVATGAAATGDARLDGQLNVLAGSLALRAHATPGYQVPVPAEGAVAAVDPLRGREIALADDTLWQNAHSQVRTEAGTRLQLQATAGGSIRLGQTSNLLDGAVSALSGAAFNTAWTAVDLLAGRQAGQSSITLAGQVVQVGGGGVEADVLRFTAGRLGTEAASPLTARLWYNDVNFGQQRSLPGLQITLLPEALATPASLGTADQPVQVNVGGLGTGGRTEGLNAGYVQLLPKRAAGGGVAVFLAGPKVGQSAYSFFQDGAGDVAEVPLFYNNVLPATPQLAGSLSAVASVSETARRERFDETVRTENVAIRLRAGVIAEVGPGRPATQGTQGIRLPSSCSSVGNVLGCGGTP